MPNGPELAASRAPAPQHNTEEGRMSRRTLDLGIPLTREQWEQLGQAANMRPDSGVLRWAPAEFDVIRVAIREDDAPAGWQAAAPRADASVSDREVARFRWN